MLLMRLILINWVHNLPTWGVGQIHRSAYHHSGDRVVTRLTRPIYYFYYYSIDKVIWNVVHYSVMNYINGWELNPWTYSNCQTTQTHVIEHNAGIGKPPQHTKISNNFVSLIFQQEAINKEWFDWMHRTRTKHKIHGQVTKNFSTFLLLDFVFSGSGEGSGPVPWDPVFVRSSKDASPSASTRIPFVDCFFFCLSLTWPEKR